MNFITESYPFSQGDYENFKKCYLELTATSQFLSHRILIDRSKSRKAYIKGRNPFTQTVVDINNRDRSILIYRKRKDIDIPPAASIQLLVEDFGNTSVFILSDYNLGMTLIGEKISWIEMKTIQPCYPTSEAQNIVMQMCALELPGFKQGITGQVEFSTQDFIEEVLSTIQKVENPFTAKNNVYKLPEIEQPFQHQN